MLIQFVNFENAIQIAPSVCSDPVESGNSSCVHIRRIHPKADEILILRNWGVLMGHSCCVTD